MPRVINDYAHELRTIEGAIERLQREAVGRGLQSEAELKATTAEIAGLMKRAKAIRTEMMKK